MAGIEKTDESAMAPAMEEDCSFVWDEESKLYYHSSTGFYHDPIAGWYYSSGDGVYYSFQNGGYVPLTCTKEENSGTRKCSSSVLSEQSEIDSSFQQHSPSDSTEIEPTPSQWIEETLIDLYLSGYNNAKVNPDSLLVSLTSAESNNSPSCQIQCEKLTDHLASNELPSCQTCTRNQQSDEWTSTHEKEMDVLTDIVPSKEEEKWQAQYGHVSWVADEDFPSFSIVDLWDWEMRAESTKKGYVARLIGRLNKRSSKLHPSVPATGGLFKTAAIHEVHLNLVRVASGRVYRLRSPATKYLISLSTYDSSNPTEGWGFPDIFSSNHEYASVSSGHNCYLDGVECTSSSMPINELSCVEKKSQKNKSTYRDRASERRSLHGAFGVGPGQKSAQDDNCGSDLSLKSEAEALHEATSASFGPGSYARKILEIMGWKHGESLGCSNNGILEPLRAVGNKGHAGLGWNAARGQN